MKKHMLGPTCDTYSAGDTASGQSSAFRSPSTAQKKDECRWAILGAWSSLQCIACYAAIQCSTACKELLSAGKG